MVIVWICADRARLIRSWKLERCVRRPKRISIHAARVDLGTRDPAHCRSRLLRTPTFELGRETNSLAPARIRTHVLCAGRSAPRDALRADADAKHGTVLGHVSLLRRH